MPVVMDFYEQNDEAHGKSKELPCLYTVLPIATRSSLSLNNLFRLGRTVGISDTLQIVVSAIDYLHWFNSLLPLTS